MSKKSMYSPFAHFSGRRLKSDRRHLSTAVPAETTYGTVFHSHELAISLNGDPSPSALGRKTVRTTDRTPRHLQP